MKTLSAPLAALAVCLFAVTACNKQAVGPAAAPTACVDVKNDTVVATYGDKKVTHGELEEFIQKDDRLSKEYNDSVRKPFLIRKSALDQIIIQDLVKKEATKRGMADENALFKAEVDDKVPAPKEEDIKKVFEENKDKMPPGSTVDSMRQQIVGYLSQAPRQERAKAFFEELKKGAGVTVSLAEPPRPPVARKQVEAVGPSKGPDNAPITIVEFSDFECPFCSRAVTTVDQVMEKYAGKVKLVFRQFPLDFHQNAQKAAEASLCAQDQGKFWELHDELFKNQRALGVDKLKEHAKKVGLDAGKFEACLTSGKHAETVKKDMDAGSKVGVDSTPAFFINGIKISGAQPIEEFSSIIDAELAGGNKDAPKADSKG